MGHGKFITIEGGDGAGKTTLLNKIESVLKNKNIPCFTTREPGGTPLAEEIRSVFLSSLAKSEPISALTELLLIQAARAQHIHHKIKPALSKGNWVLCDRFIWSTVAYQGYGRGLDINLIQNLNSIATNQCKPDLTILLTLDPQIALLRREARGDQSRLDLEKNDFHEKVSNGYMEIAKTEKHSLMVISADQNAEKVFQSVLEHPKWKALFS